MSTVDEIVEQAFRESNFVGELDNPTPKQAREAITRLDRIVSGLYGFEAGEHLQPWPVGVAGYQQPVPGEAYDCWRNPIPNSRLVCNLTAAQTVYLPCAPEDGARIGVQDLQGNFATYPLTIDGNGRTIEGAQSLVLNTNGANAIWFYRADLGDWKRVSSLAAGDDFPFPSEFDDLFIVRLAMRLNPRYGKTVAPESVDTAERCLDRFRARYAQHRQMPVPLALLNMSRQAYPPFGNTWGHTYRSGPYGDWGWPL